LFSINRVPETVEVGVRPEDIALGKKRKADLRVRVEMLSNFGAEKYVHTSLGESSITVRASKDATYNTGQMISLFVDSDKPHIFYEGQRV